MSVDVIGRDGELAAIHAFLDGPAPHVLVLEGEAGIGKTTLWRRGLELASAAGYRVLSCSPAGSEAQLSFAGLGDLLDGVLEEVLGPLPEPQRRALSIALLLEGAEGPPPDQLAVALAFLGALRALAAGSPLVLAVDDIQWLDRASAFVLGFALRRLRDERVTTLFGLRSGHADAALGLERSLAEERLERLTVGPLSVGAVHRLLGDRLGLVLTRPKLRRLHELSGGNPFFALELGRAFGRQTIKLEAGESLPPTLASLVDERIAALPSHTRSTLVAVSALSHPTLDLLARAVGDRAEQSLEPAHESNVIELDDARIRFSHPLLASAVYGTAGAVEKRALHRRLAAVVADPEERARHLALAAKRPDRDVSAALEEAARLAHQRGAPAAATELSEQACRLTPEDQDADRHRRTIQAGTYAFGAGAGVRARSLFEGALEVAPPGSRRAEALAWLGTLEEYDGDVNVAVRHYREGLAEAGDDLALRAQLEDWLGDALFLMRADLEPALSHARSAVALAARIGDLYRTVSALSGEALVAAAMGRPDWNTVLDRATELERRVVHIELIVTPAFHRALILMWLDDFDQARAILTSLCERADERGEEGALPMQLVNLSLAEQLAGRWEDATRHASEGIEIAEQIGQESVRVRALGARALVGALRGDADEARRDAHATLSTSRERGVMLATMSAASGLAVLALSLGDPEAAHSALGPVVEHVEAGGVREPGSVRFVFDDVEALIGMGRTEEAEALLARWEARARRLDRASALASAERCRGLLSAARGDLDGALESLERAVGQHYRVAIPFERARTLLALGRIQRRARRRRAARDSLEAARANFEELGARLWSEQAREEIGRIGGRRASDSELTPTERRIAALVAEGKTNKEVAAILVVADRTVESALTQIYRKLDVRSRTELARKLAIPG